MAEGKRIRLIFRDDDILSDAQKFEGLSRSWVLLKPHQHDAVSDLASHLLHAFQLHQSCPHGLLLSVRNHLFFSLHLLWLVIRKDPFFPFFFFLLLCMCWVVNQIFIACDRLCGENVLPFAGLVASADLFELMPSYCMFWIEE